MTTQFKVIGFDKVRGRYKNRVARARNTQRALHNLGALIDGVTKRNFVTSGLAHDPPKKWKALKSATIKEKKRIGRNSGILIRFGRLKKDWILKVTKKNLLYMSFARSKKENFPYGNAHHTGANITRKTKKGTFKIKLPKRRFLPTKKHTRKMAKRVMLRNFKVIVNTR